MKVVARRGTTLVGGRRVSVSFAMIRFCTAGRHLAGRPCLIAQWEAGQSDGWMLI